MRAYFAALLLAAGLLCSCAHAPQSKGPRMIFQETKAEAEQGDVGSQISLGSHYERGDGVEKDYVQAVKWFRKAAEQGDPTAQRCLGDCYHEGKGVKEDHAEAVKWFLKAAKQGEFYAQKGLVVSYDLGQGVTKDYAEAYAWLGVVSKTLEDREKPTVGRKMSPWLAARLGLDPTTLKDANRYRDKLAKKMSPQQVGDAQKRTEKLRAQIKARMKSCN